MQEMARSTPMPTEPSTCRTTVGAENRRKSSAKLSVLRFLLFTQTRQRADLAACVSAVGP